jgi:hypothetical protein
MVKLLFLGVAATVASIALGTAAFAQQKADPGMKVYAQRDVCAPHNMGNPYSRETDYWDWSSWQSRGGWDARNDFNCAPSRQVR